MAQKTHEDKIKEIKTWSLDTPFARDEESDFCEWCGLTATHWTQLERGEQPLSRAFFHCERHELNAQMLCTSDENFSREEIMESNKIEFMMVTINYRTVLNGNPVASEASLSHTSATPEVVLSTVARIVWLAPPRTAISITTLDAPKSLSEVQAPSLPALSVFLKMLVPLPAISRIYI